MNRINMTNMTKTKIGFAILVAIFVGGGKSLSSLHAQSFSFNFIVSNLDQPQPDDHTFVEAPDRYIAAPFTTGSQAATFDRLVINLNSYDDQDFIALWDNSALNLPNSELFTFQNPPQAITTNLYGLTPPSSVGMTNLLSANTTYWLVFGVPTDAGDFEIGNTSSTSETGQWTIGDFSRRRSTDRGATWNLVVTGESRFGIEATIIPESETYLLASGLMIGIFILVRRRIAKRIAKSL